MEKILTAYRDVFTGMYYVYITADTEAHKRYGMGITLDEAIRGLKIRMYQLKS